MSKPEEQTEQPKETLLESISSICGVLAIGLFVMTFVFQNFVIPSGSMEKTLLVGDHVFVDRMTFAPPSRWMPLTHYREPQRGDIIVFYKPHPEQPDFILVKRLVGLPGDRIHLHNGVLYVNGVEQHEPQISMPGQGDKPGSAYEAYRDDFPSDMAEMQEIATFNKAAEWAVDLPNHVVNGELVVPPGTVFALGDNRVGSLDGRFWGFVPRENILGRPLFVYWSFESPEVSDTEPPPVSSRIGSLVDTALHFFSKTRWSRTFHLTR